VATHEPPLPGHGAVLTGIAAVGALVAIALSAGLSDRADLAAPVQLVCTAIAVILVGLASWWDRPGHPRPRLSATRVLLGAALVGAAILLRLALHDTLPPPDRSGFEELEMGQDAWDLLTHGELSLDFRLSKVMAAAGLAIGGESLEALRWPFRIAGYLNLLLAALCLTHLRVRWPALAFVLLTTATARWLVIGSAVAYEDFSSTPVELLLLLAVLKAASPGNGLLRWAAVAGLASGILMFANSSFRFLILLAGAWFVWCALRATRQADRWAPALFLSVLVAIAAPTVVDIAVRGTQAGFFEPLVRHASDRAGRILAFNVTSHLLDATRMFAGLPVRLSFYLVPDGDRAFHPILGFLFLSGLLIALAAGKAVERALALSAVAATVACCAVSNGFVASRLAPVVPILILLGGVVAGRAHALLARGIAAIAQRAPGGGGSSPSSVATVPASIVFAAATVAMVLVNVGRIESMAVNPIVVDEYSNDTFLVSRCIARRAHPRQTVVIHTEPVTLDWSANLGSAWLYAKLQPRIVGLQRLPEVANIPPSALVIVAAMGRPLRAVTLARVEALAGDVHASESLRVTKDKLGRPFLVSFIRPPRTDQEPAESKPPGSGAVGAP
jgi:hypothetical protein